MTNGDDQPREDIEVGTPGASARARYRLLRERDDRRRRQMFGPLAPLVALVTGPDGSTEAWARGAEGEERIGALLSRVVGGRGIVLHDRRRPGGRANLDHIAVVPSGVWVVDAKHYRGRLARRRVGGCFTTRAALFVGRRECSALLSSARRQRGEVARLVPSHIAVRAALCFTGVELGLLARPFTLDGVLVTWPKALAKTLRAPGHLDGAAVHEVAAALARAFPPSTYAPSGTSHRPTGAPPSA